MIIWINSPYGVGKSTLAELPCDFRIETKDKCPEELALDILQNLGL